MEPTRRLYTCSQVSFMCAYPIRSILKPFVRIDSLNVRDDTEIDWKLIPDADWNLWSAHTLQRRWLTLKKGVKGYEEMTHQGGPLVLPYILSPV